MLSRNLTRALTSAALALPGVAASLPAAAQMAPPDKMTVGMKWMEYQEFDKKNNSLMAIRAPYVYMSAPVDEHIGIEGGLLLDSITGATPIAPVASGGGTGSGTTTSGASGGGGPTRSAFASLMNSASSALNAASSGTTTGGTTNVLDTRVAFDGKATYYFDRAAAGLGMAYSREQDWVSHSGSLDVRIASADNNRIYAAGIGYNHDAIASVADSSIDESRSTWEGILGVTQVISQTQLVQSNLTLSYGSGFFNDVYRTGDVRPDERLAGAWLTRYRHYVPAADGAVHVDYRLFADDWGMVAHTVELAWYQQVSDDWTVRPFMRYHSQDKTRFYSPAAASTDWTGLFSNDPRLGSFGALSSGFAVEKSFEDGWTVQMHAEYYERNADWHLTANGSDGVDPLKSVVVIMGVRKSF